LGFVKALSASANYLGLLYFVVFGYAKEYAAELLNPS
jgi:hypothetical protein